MKRFIYLLLVAMIPVLGFSQVKILQKTDVLSDKTDDFGSRVISSQYYDVFSTLVSVVNFSLDCVVTRDTKPSYFLHLNLIGMGEVLIEGGKVFLIKLENGEVIELKSNEKSTYTRRANGSIVTQPTYEVTEEELNRLTENKIIKIRIEYNGGHIDRDYKKNKFGNNLKTAYNAIKLALTKEGKTIRDDF